MFFKILFVVNFVLSFVIIFYEKDNFRNLVKWFFISLLFPIIGFVSYIVLGNKLKFREKEKILSHKIKTEDYIKLALKNNSLKYKTDGLWNNNKIDYFFNQYDFLYDLINEINKSKSTINIQFYIFSDDYIGSFIANYLIKKAKQGVKVRIIYDFFGSGKTNKNFWQNLLNNNIEVVSFLPARIGNHIFNFKINYRNHRKIIIIDGKTSYIGGLNLRNDHFGLTNGLKPWNDCMIKIKGYCTYALQNTFLNDFYYSTNKIPTINELKTYFPRITLNGNINLKLINGDPTEDINSISKSYFTYIKNAKKFVFISTPYFIVNKQFINELVNKVNKHIDVYIFIPQKPDKRLIYSATLNCLKPLFNAGAKIFLVDGFLHSKIFATEKIISIGSCNFDNRSFNLNFETNVFCFDKEVINNILSDFCKINKTLLTKRKYKKLRAKYFHLLLISKLLFKIL